MLVPRRSHDLDMPGVWCGDVRATADRRLPSCHWWGSGALVKSMTTSASAIRPSACSHVPGSPCATGRKRLGAQTRSAPEYRGAQRLSAAGGPWSARSGPHTQRVAYHHQIAVGERLGHRVQCWQAKISTFNPKFPWLGAGCGVDLGFCDGVLTTPGRGGGRRRAVRRRAVAAGWGW